MRPRNQKGFTLIELLVVLLIIGIVATAAFLAAGDFGKGKSIQVSGEQFKNLLNLAKERAILTEQPIGVSVTKTGYAFFIPAQKEKGWQPLNDSVLTPQYFPEGTLVILKSSHLKSEVQLMINPEGEISEFQLQLYEGNQLITTISHEN